MEVMHPFLDISLLGAEFSSKEASLPIEKHTQRLLFVSLRRDPFLAAVETGRADVVTTMNFARSRFNSGRRIR